MSNISAKTLAGPGLDLHHMTAIVGNAQRNVDFYTQVLGLRVTKITVNFDDPGAYHLYYGDAVGTPGTSLTFFPYTGRQAKPGPGQVVVTHLGIPEGSLGAWKERLSHMAVPLDGDFFLDPDGLQYKLVEAPALVESVPWSAVVPDSMAIRGMSGITIQDGSANRDRSTANVVENVLGYRPHESGWITESGKSVIEIAPSEPDDWGHGGSGGVHHIAFRMPDDETHIKMHGCLYEEGFHSSPIMDRTYFHSIYFREPGGVLFELATDGPGFLIDETVATLGTTLRLPPQYESIRDRIEAALPKLRLPEPVEVTATGAILS